MSDDAVTYRSQVAIVTINRAERMNRLDDGIVEGLHHAWRRFMARDEDRIAVVTGAGDKAFGKCQHLAQGVSPAEQAREQRRTSWLLSPNIDKAAPYGDPPNTIARNEVHS